MQVSPCNVTIRALSGSWPLRLLRWVALVAGLSTASAPAALAQLVDVPPTWGGDPQERPRLTGSWGGLRDELGRKGIVFDVDLLATPMEVVRGGRYPGNATWANLDYTLNVDTDKAGLWPGGYLEIAAGSGFGENVLFDSGALVPVNTAALLPAENVQTTGLLAATFMQFFNQHFGVVLGKFNTLESGALEFYGDYRTQFLNSAFVCPMTAEQVPLSAYGAGIVVLPGPDLSLSLVVLDPNGTPTSSSLNDAFSNGAMVLGSGELTLRPHRLLGHQDFGFAWSNTQRYSLDQEPANLARFLLQTAFPRLGQAGPVIEQILRQYFPGLRDPNAQLATRSSSWSFSYGFDQYLWQPPGDEKHGVGVFFSAGASDGNPNPVKYALLLGVGGKGVPGRLDDSYGIGIARTQISSAFLPYVTQRLGLGLDHEDALEMYYNLAVTGWLSVTADLQVVDPGLKKTLNLPAQSLENVDTALIAGLRFRVRF